MQMTKNVSNDEKFDANAVFFWGLLLALGLAFVQPLHIWPFSNHLEDIGLGASVIVLAGVILLRHGRFVVNQLLWWWLAFGVLLLVAACAVERSFDSPLYGYVAFWLVGVALIQLGGIFSWRRDERLFSIYLSWFLFGVSFLSLLLGLVKFYGLWGGLSAYFPELGGGRIKGVMNQSNFFAVLTLMGLCSFLWLVHGRSISYWLLLPLGLVYCYVLTLSGTRVIYLAYLAFFVIALFQARRSRKYDFLFLLLMSGVFFYLARSSCVWLDAQVAAYLKSLGSVPWSEVDADLLERVTQNPLNDARFEEWGVAWGLFKENLPWGVGPGGYPAASYEFHLRENKLPMQSIWLHSHNSYLQILVEFGVGGALWMLGMGWVVSKVLWRAMSLDSPIQVMVLSSVLVYSFFEFPLWYMSFFVLALFVLAAGVSSREVVGGRFFGGVSAVMAAMALILYAWLFSGLLKWFLIGESKDFSFVDRLAQDPLLRSEGLLFYYNYFGVNPRVVDVELSELERLYHYRPYNVVSMRYAINLAIVGRKVEALKVRDELLLAFPGEVENFRNRVEREWQAQPSWEIGFLLEGLPLRTPDPSVSGARGDFSP